MTTKSKELEGRIEKIKDVCQRYVKGKMSENYFVEDIEEAKQTILDLFKEKEEEISTLKEQLNDYKMTNDLLNKARKIRKEENTKLKEQIKELEANDG